MTFCDYMNHFDIYYHISVHYMTITLYSITCVNIYIDIISMNYGSSLSPWPQGQWPQEFPPWRWQAPGALPVGYWWWKVLGKYTSKNSWVCGGYMLYDISIYIYRMYIHKHICVVGWHYQATPQFVVSWVYKPTCNWWDLLWKSERLNIAVLIPEKTPRLRLQSIKIWNNSMPHLTVSRSVLWKPGNLSCAFPCRQFFNGCYLQLSPQSQSRKERTPATVNSEHRFAWKLTQNIRLSDMNMPILSILALKLYTSPFQPNVTTTSGSARISKPNRSHSGE